MPVRITLKDISARTGYSVSAVSRALSPVRKKNDTLSSSAREAIQRASREMGYQCNLQASTLRRGRLSTVGVFLPRWGRGMLFETIAGISDMASKCGVPLSLHFDLSAESCDAFIESMRDRGSVGIICYCPRGGGEGLGGEACKRLDGFERGGGAVVMLNSICYPDVKFRHVSIDEGEGGRLAGSALCRCGCSSFYCFRHSGRLYERRYSAFRMAIGEDLPVFSCLVSGPEGDERLDMGRWLECIFGERGSGKKIGLFMTSELMSNFFCLWANRSGLKSGVDYIAIGYGVGGGGTEIFDLPRVIQPFYLLGYHGFGFIEKIISGYDVESEVLLPQLEGDFPGCKISSIHQGGGCQ